jgi:hypothetical protein
MPVRYSYSDAGPAQRRPAGEEGLQQAADRANEAIRNEGVMAGFQTFVTRPEAINEEERAAQWAQRWEEMRRQRDQWEREHRDRRLVEQQERIRLELGNWREQLRLGPTTITATLTTNADFGNVQYNNTTLRFLSNPNPNATLTVGVAPEPQKAAVHQFMVVGEDGQIERS